MTRPPFTDEQLAAIADRSGSRLLAANAGSGKTAVMVERFVEAVVDDGVPVGGILALTFTEKAAGELRERIRRRFTDLGEHEHARAAEGAWIGTIHGFCARVLRAHPFAAGMDPRFTVLDEAAASRLRDVAWEQAVEAWAAEEGEPAVDLLAAYGNDLRTMVFTAYDELRSRGHARPRLELEEGRVHTSHKGARDTLGAALDAAAHVLASAGDGVRINAARDALIACREVFDAGGVPFPGALDAASLPSGAKVLAGPECEAYREALTAYVAALADHHARPVLVLADRLLARFTAACERLKAARAAVDFEDLQLAVRDLLAGDDGLRARWAERFALIMVDEFQDTNRLQLDVLEMLERANLFAVGDEFQSIYGFRHADVTIFRERGRALGADGTRRLRANFRSRRELLDVLSGAFAPIFGDAFEPLVAGRAEAPPPAAEGRLFDPDRVDAAGDDVPPVELLVTHTKDWEDHPAGPALPGEKPHRRAEAALIAQRLREEVDRGRRAGEIAVLVRAAASLRLLEQALEERGLPTYVVGGRGYWSQEQVRDGLAYLSVLANPLDETSLYAVLASPFGGLGADGLILLAQAGREAGGAWAALRARAGWQDALPEGDREALDRLVPLLAAERAQAERLPAEVLLERAIAATGYDVAVLARPGGERRLANLRKLMRLARDFERAEGRDLRGFIAYARTQDLATAREGEAAMEGEGLDAVRLMTIHRAKGLEFPVVCVADLGRQGPGGAAPLLLGRDGRVGLRFRALGSASSVPALDYGALDEERKAAEDEEERRLLYVAMTRAREKLILSGSLDVTKPPQPRPGGAPLCWIAGALLDAPAQLDSAPPIVERRWQDRPARLAVTVSTAGGGVLRPAAPVAPPSVGTVLPVAPTLDDVPVAAANPVLPGLPRRLSYTSLGDYGRCGYRWYLQRALGLPEVEEPAAMRRAAPAGVLGEARAPEVAEPALDPRVRGTLVHVLLEELDFARPQAPSPEAVATVAAANGADPTPDEVADVRRLVEAFAASPLCARVARARGVRREAPFAFALEPGPGSLLVHGVVDVLATEPDGTVLVVDYKTDRIDDADPEELTSRDYGTQRLVYALAALRQGAPRVEVAHCFLERPEETALATFTAADADELAERLVGVAGGVLRSEFPVAERPHRDLCGTCPGRRTLCSHPEALTLRTAEQAMVA
jgi:ATP-dependent helicase/nuclease subunit A